MQEDMSAIVRNYKSSNYRRKAISSIVFTVTILLSSHATMQLGMWQALASTDEDGDGLSYGIEFIINTQPQDWDSDNDGLPDGWEWQYGLDPLSSSGDDGSTGDPDSDSLTNLFEYLYGIPSGWDEQSTPNILDNGVWWNGTVPVRNWDEESALQINQGLNSDGFDEDPWGNMCTDTFDNDKDGLVDMDDGDRDGDLDCSSNDDDGDGLIDEDPNGWDTDGDGMPDGWEVAHGLSPISNSNQDGTFGDPDEDGLVNIYEYVNPAWGTRNGSTFPPTQYFRPGPINMTATESPCNPILFLGPGGCQIFTAEVDGITSTDPMDNDTDDDGLNDSFEALILLTDPTAVDTDSDGISDGNEVNGLYGEPPQGSDPRNNNSDGDFLDDGEEDINGNGVIDDGETDPTRVNDEGDWDGDGIQNWQENNSCTLWNVADTDGGGVNDGDEISLFRNTDPCRSTSELEFTIIEWDGARSTLVLNSTLGINPNTDDWRRSGAPMAYYQDSDGNRTPFMYSGVLFSPSNALQGVNTELPGDVDTIIITNGSWCWNATIGANNPDYCDDDYLDSDGDGLADWEELMATWGYVSFYDNPDSDGDGVDDLSEIQNDTDPLEPCHNLLDFDGDGLNNYFENTTGCSMEFGIIGGNLTLDPWFTLWNNPDSDNGGVVDGQEYVDGTNPQDNPSDDINPLDTDGDGIPDTIEQEIGTDWRNPDTDGGGIPDGEECPEEFWLINCFNSASNPLNRFDDIDENELYFTASNKSSGMDPTITHYWRWHTYDQYNGISWGVNSTLVGYTEISNDWSTSQGVADSSLWNHSGPLPWEILFDQSGYIFPGNELIQPHNSMNFTSWSDSSAGLNFSNFSRDIIVDLGIIEALYVTAPEVIINEEVRQNSTPFSSTSYALDLPSNFLESNSHYVKNVTNAVINEAGAISSWDKVVAIQDFLINGNDTTKFLRNYEGSARIDGLGIDSDISHWILNSSLEASCDEFTSLFTTMVRLSGIPARKVSGFSGGIWDGKSFSVYGNNFTRWTEVHLETNQNQGSIDLGWIPFEACPPESLIGVVNSTWGPNSIERNTTLTESIWLEGQLQFSENSTFAENISINLYLVTNDDVQNIPGSAALNQYLISNATTGFNGSFNISGIPSEVINPGFGNLVILTEESGYVGIQGISSDWEVNVTDDVILIVSEPPPIEQPMLGVGVNSTISGQLSWSSSPFYNPTDVDNLQVSLSYFTQIDGAVNISTNVSSGGYFEFLVSIDDLEPLGLINATIEFSGWHQSDLNNATIPEYHARPKTLELELNITPSPNLTISLESQGTNNSILEVDSPIFLNGTVFSRGINPEPVNGTLILQMRRSDVAGPFETLRTWYLNSSSWPINAGEISVNWSFLSSEVSMPAGLVDVRIQFDADDFFANDQIIFSGQYGIRSFIQFNYNLSNQERGVDANIEVLLTDHTGNSFADFEGLYTLDYDGEEVWNDSNPSSPRLGVSWTPNLSTLPGDYSWQLNFSGSTWLQPNFISEQIRIQGQANSTASIVNEWTMNTETNWVFGNIRDMALDFPITGNNTSISVRLLIPSDLPASPDGNPAPPDSILLGTGFVNTVTGSYNISFIIPDDIPSGVYTLSILGDFRQNPPIGGYYYTVSESTDIPIGIQSTFFVEHTPNQAIVVAGENLSVEVTISDLQKLSNKIKDADVEMYFDWGGSLQQLLDSEATDQFGQTTLSGSIPTSTPPGFYDVRIFAPDDISDNLSDENAGRWLSNFSIINLTVQVSSLVEIISTQDEVTALQFFYIEGNVLDSSDVNRSIQGPVGLEVFFLDEPGEILIENFTTSSNGSFNISVPTDTAGNGVTRGIRTVVVSVLNSSSPFYLTGTGTSDILVKGISQFISTTPVLNSIIERGNNAIITTQLVEFSNNQQPLDDFEISVKFHKTWLQSQSTNENGAITFSFEIPQNHPLGLINFTLFFNGSFDLNSVSRSYSTITISSSTNLIINEIIANPMPGEYFNISGTIQSSNGSSLTNRIGNLINPAFIFSINGQSSNFVVSQVNFQTDSSWSTEIRLDLSFPRGTHTIAVEYVPDVNYFISSSSSISFDSRGYSLISIETPGDLDPDSRVLRGDLVEVNISLVDNSDSPIQFAQISLQIDGNVEWTGFTNSLGFSSAIIATDPLRKTGPMTITAVFSGTEGTTGLLGDEVWTRIIILAPSVLEIYASETANMAGGEVTFSGKLLDEYGNSLIQDGFDKGGLIRLTIDKIDVGPLYTTLSNATTGNWSITYDIPDDMQFGSHEVEASFLGGFAWVDPMGQGDSINPEYYLPSSATSQFNVTQQSQVIINSPPQEVDRSQLVSVEGLLTDGVGRILSFRDIQVTMNNQFLTALETDENGSFSIFIPVPSDMPLGPRIVMVSFLGEQFITSSNSTTIFTVFGPTIVSIDDIPDVAVGDEIILSGQLRDNLESGWISNHTVEIFVEGVLIGITSSDELGRWILPWKIPDSLEIGNHTVSIISPSQGFYRMGFIDTTLTVSYHTQITIELEKKRVTRGDTWNFSGRLFENDTGFYYGLENRQIIVMLDEEIVGETMTMEGGLFTFNQSVSYYLSRGIHNLSFSYGGEFLYLPTNINISAIAQSDITIEAQEISSIIIRGNVSHPIVIQGIVREVGGDSSIINNLSISLLFGEQNLPITQDPWINQDSLNFEIISKAQEFMSPGKNIVSIIVDPSSELFLNGKSLEMEILVLIEIDFIFSSIEINTGQRVIRGTVNATATDTGEPVKDLEMIAILSNETSPQSLITRFTNADGVFEYEFKSLSPLPPFSDIETWGTLSVSLDSDSEFIDSRSLTLLGKNGVNVVYSIDDSDSILNSMLVWIGLTLVISLALIALTMYRRKEDSTMKELANIFNYAAEMLASGDEYRRAIFECYENLCLILKKRKFLRRDFETVREFEIAIRKALPISEESLISLDRVFEEARYSSHKLGELERQNAQLSLSSVLREIEELQEIPEREIYLETRPE